MAWTVFLEGFGMSMGLIVAIGAQNAYVLRQGIRKQRRLLAASFCALMDAILICLGVLGFGAFINEIPMLMRILTGGGSLFLFWYGIRSLRSIRHPAVLEAAPEPGRPEAAAAVLGSLAAFTLLNPHVWLDTVVLLGGLGGKQAPGLRGWFVAGATLASLIWFFALSFGAGFLAPLFRKPITWKVLDALIAVIMFVLGAQLALWAIGVKFG